MTVLFTNGEQMDVERAAVTVQKGRSPIDAWPDAFIFFDRCVRLLTSVECRRNSSIHKRLISVLKYHSLSSSLRDMSCVDCDNRGQEKHGP